MPRVLPTLLAIPVALASLVLGCRSAEDAPIDEDADVSDSEPVDGIGDSASTDSGAIGGDADSTAADTAADSGMPPGGWRSALFPATWKPLHAGGSADAQGRALPDFAYAGYHRGEQRPPYGLGAVVSTVSASLGDGVQDATAGIQSAINAGCTAGGGVVRIPDGTYKVKLPSDTAAQALLVSCSKLVVRGDGPTRTRILFDDARRARGKSVIAFRVAGSDASGTAIPLTADVTRPTRTLSLASTTGLTVGTAVTVRNDVTDAFRADHRMDPATSGLTGLWVNDFRSVGYHRTIVSVATNSITLDAPIHYALKTRDNARVFKRGALITEVVLESLAIGMVENKTTPTKPERDSEGDYGDSSTPTTGYEVHDSRAISFGRVKDGWLYDVDTFKPAVNTITGAHVLSRGINFDFEASRITAEKCDLGRPQYRGGGGNGYLLMVGGHDLLIKDSSVTGARHGVTLNQAISGDVMLRVTFNDSRMSDDTHRYLSHAILWDSSVLNSAWLQSVNRAQTSGGAGFTGTQVVFWNTHVAAPHPTAKGCAVESEQFAWGYLIGSSAASGTPLLCTATVTNSTWAAADPGLPLDFTEGQGLGATLYPSSLYEAQRQLRCTRDGISCSPSP